MLISSSDINVFLECRRKWDYSSDNRQRLEPIAPVPALFLGSGIHEALEAFYNGEADDPADAFEAWAIDTMAGYTAAGVRYNEELIMKEVAKGIAMLRGYVEEYGVNPQADRDGIRIITTEHQFKLPIPGTDDGWFVGRLDGLLTDTRGLAWVFETKTYTQAPRDFSHILQQIAYVWAANRLVKGGAFVGIGLEPTRRVYGTLYNGLRKQIPGPRVTVDLFKREWVGRTVLELYLFEKELAKIHRVMSDPDKEIFPTYSKNCSWCSFQSPCSAKSLGEDEESELRMNYRRQPPRGEVYQEEGEL